MTGQSSIRRTGQYNKDINESILESMDQPINIPCYKICLFLKK